MKQLSLFPVADKEQVKTSQAKTIEPKAIADVDYYQMFTDGASKGNPGDAGIGIACNKNRKTWWQKGFYIGTATNNFAEFSALVAGLWLLKQEQNGKVTKLDIFCDSQLLVFQVTGLYKNKSLNIKFLLDTAKELLKNFVWKISYIPREQNTVADKMANEGIKTKTLLPEALQDIIFPTAK